MTRITTSGTTDPVGRVAVTGVKNIPFQRVRYSVTSGEEFSQGTCSESVSGSDQQSVEENDQGEATVLKAPGQPRQRRPANLDQDISCDYPTCPDDSDTEKDERPPTSYAADVPTATTPPQTDVHGGLRFGF
uniref:Uncharacterized protein n=1 Tax=Branchiostoma floridae TaxID=7739 RepID=C3YUN2_BRAFL|eukprot:XP_002599921.1 hypothetical protein BRAFLDRAFT_74045 [Branchiostoma floridae]